MVPATHSAAVAKMAALMKAESDFFDSHNLEGGPGIELSDKDSVEYRTLQNAVYRFGEELAAHPTFADVMICWMVDIHGVGEPDRATMLMAVEDGVSRESMDNLIGLIGGNLAMSVQQAIFNCGFEVGDRGGGVGGWDVGVACNNEEVVNLTKMLHTKFEKAIAAGLITVSKKFWRFRLPELRNWDDVQRYYTEKGE